MAGATAPAFLFGARRPSLRVLRSSPGGATESAASDFPVAALSPLETVMTTTLPATRLLLLRMPSLR
jgi:hypothetical protein